MLYNSFISRWKCFEAWFEWVWSEIENKITWWRNLRNSFKDPVKNQDHCLLFLFPLRKFHAIVCVSLQCFSYRKGSFHWFRSFYECCDDFESFSKYFWLLLVVRILLPLFILWLRFNSFSMLKGAGHLIIAFTLEGLRKKIWKTIFPKWIWPRTQVWFYLWVALTKNQVSCCFRLFAKNSL